MKAFKALITEFYSGIGIEGQLLRGGVLSLVVKLMSTVMALVLAIVLARMLGAEGFGIYSFVFALISILAIPAQLGLPNLVVRETAKAQVTKRWDIIKGLWRWASLVALAMSAALMSLGVAAAWLLADEFSSVHLQTLWWGLLLVPLVALGNLRGAALRGLRKVVQGQLPEFILRPLFLVILSLIFNLFLGLSFGPAEAMFLHVAAALGAFIVGARLLVQGSPTDLRREKSITMEPKAWFFDTLPLALVAGMQIISANTGVIFLGFFQGPEQVADFRIAMQVSLLVTMGSYAVNQAGGPYFSHLYAARDIILLQKSVTYMSIISFIFGFPVFISLILFGGLIIQSIFGLEFHNAAYPAGILAFGQLISAMSSSANTLLSMTGHATLVARNAVCTVALNIVLASVLIPYWGAVGAAIGATIAIVFHVLVLRMITKKKIGVDPSILSLFRRTMDR